jgi:hypothetical protein
MEASSKATETLDKSSKFYLQVPENPRMHLISPPGSPPVGWEPEPESVPNPCALASDVQIDAATIRVTAVLSEAAAKLRALADNNNNMSLSSPEGDCSEVTIIVPGQSHSLPVILVQDHSEVEKIQSTTAKRSSFPRSRLPPLS